MVIAAPLLTFFLILWVYFIWTRRKYYAFIFKMPGPLGLPLIGIAHKIRPKDMLYVLPRYAIEYKTKTFFTWIGPFPVIYSMDPKFAEIILNNLDCINKSFIYNVVSDVLGDGIATSKIPVWNKNRKLLNPCFNHKTLVGFFPCFNKLSSELCEKFDQHVNCGEVDVKKLVFDMVLKTAVSTTIGWDFKNKSNETFLNHCENVGVVITERIMKPWLLYPAILRTSSIYTPFIEGKTCIKTFVRELVMGKIEVVGKNGLETINNSTEESIDTGKSKHTIFIDQIINIYQRKYFTFDDVVTESSFLLFAAFETSGTTIFSTLMFLAMFPQYQEKVFEELVAVYPDENFNVNYEDLKNLVYLERCINETLRIAASIPIIGRECARDIPLSKDLVIPKGTQILLDVFNIHKDEDVWGPNAKIYDPDNVLPSNLASKHKYSYIPFSKGQRNCIGWQYALMFLKVVLAQILRKYRFSTKFRFDDLQFAEHITLRYENIPNLEIQRR